MEGQNVEVKIDLLFHTYYCLGNSKYGRGKNKNISLFGVVEKNFFQ